MCSLNEMLLRIILVKENIIPFTSEIIQQTNEEVEIVDLNKEQLYEFGIDSKKRTLSPYRSKHYADMKADLRQGKELTDLFLSGEFQRNFYIIVQGEQYGISSTDWKTQKLIEKYGEDIFGLDDENKEKAYLIIRPSLLVKVNEILQCTIS